MEIVPLDYLQGAKYRSTTFSQSLYNYMYFSNIVPYILQLHAFKKVKLKINLTFVRI